MPEFVLIVPIDVSKAEEREAGAAVRVAAVTEKGTLVSQAAKLNRAGKAKVKLEFDERPRDLKVYVGPGDAKGEELPKLQSLEVRVPRATLAESDQVELESVVVKPAQWIYWLRWCRDYEITGRITCPDGSGVPGAEVTAFDIDWCWYWVSKLPVATAVTDQQGYYTLKFRWCCGWRPWWWWTVRHWRLDPELLERIQPLLQLDPDLPKPPRPTPTPDPEVFKRLLEEVDDFADPRLLDVGGRHEDTLGVDRLRGLRRPDRPDSLGDLGGNLGVDPGGRLDPEILTRLRDPLLRRLPRVEELIRLRVWPWYPWCGWLDCAPDLVFRVTQDCGDEEDKLLIDENLLSTRWDVADGATINLMALDACCVDDTPQPPGDCLNLTHVCSVPVSSIGGNPTASVATPAGYVGPGVSDRPFGGVVLINGDFGTAAKADYYEVEWFDPSEPPSTAWKPLPPGSLLGFNRQYFGPDLPSGATATHTVKFPVQVVDGRRVIESRQHFQSQNESASWENLSHPEDRWWTNNKTRLAGWSTDGFFADGTYRLRIKSWELVAPDTLGNPQILEICGDDDEAGPHELVLTVDNRIVTSALAHGDPCGPGTVHICTEEPDTRILEVAILDASDAKKADLDACDEVEILPTDKLRVRFRASDSDGHLSRYTMRLTYGENAKRDLIGGGAPTSVSHGPVGSTIPGPRYADALSATGGSISPTWEGGVYELTAPAAYAFPKTCCYQLELRAFKRTIVDCNGNEPHRNLSVRSFMVRRP